MMSAMDILIVCGDLQGSGTSLTAQGCNSSCGPRPLTVFRKRATAANTEAVILALGSGAEPDIPPCHRPLRNSMAGRAPTLQAWRLRLKVHHTRPTFRVSGRADANVPAMKQLFPGRCALPVSNVGSDTGNHSRTIVGIPLNGNRDVSQVRGRDFRRRAVAQAI